MEQQQSIGATESHNEFKVSFSVGTKVLISLIILLGVVIAFLSVSTVLLLREDKKAYTYQAQATQAVLAGREFANSVKHNIDTLRTALGTVDPLRSVTQAQSGALRALVSNQSGLSGVTVGLMDIETGEVAESAHAGDRREIESEKIKAIAPEIAKNSFAIVNLSQIDSAPAVGVFLADLNARDSRGRIPVAMGVAPLKGFGDELSGMNLTVGTQSGRILFDTDPGVLYSDKDLRDDPLFQATASSKLTSGAQEYEQDGVHYLSSYVQPGMGLLVFTKTDWKKATRATYELIVKFALLGLMAIGVAVIFAIFFSNTLTAPINRLYEATKEVAKGNFNLNLSVDGKDEIGALTGSFNVMSSQISELMDSQADKIHLENELAIASTVQQTLIPPPAFENGEIKIFSHYQSASQCGGDWWGFFGVGKKMCLMIADATGHGMPSALITASARSCFSVMHKLAQEDPEFTFSPAGMLSFANRVVYDASMGKIMMTFFVAVIDFEKKTLSYANAGHNPPWLFKKKDGAFALNSLVSVGQRLGESRDVSDFEEKTVELSPGDMLFMYTDGVLEGKNVEGEMYGKKRVRKAVEGNLAGGPRKVVESLMTEFLHHNEGKELDDDVTLAVATIMGNA